MAKASTKPRMYVAPPTPGTIPAVMAAILAAIQIDVGVKALYPGDNIVWDFCECEGQLGVLLTGVSPFGPVVCPQGWRLDVTFSVVRCVSTLDGNGNPPTPAEMLADEMQILTDMQVMAKEILSLETTVPAVIGVALGEWIPEGPQSGCGGGAWTSTITIPICWP